VPLIEIRQLDDPRVDDYRDIRDRDWWRRRGLFVVEGRGTLRCLVERSALRPKSVLLGEPARAALGDVLARLDPEIPVYTAPRDVLEAVAGFAIHRGCLAVAPRPPESGLAGLVERLPEGDSRVVVLEGLSNHDNVGGVFRNAMAFGADAVVLCPRCCDPLYRKAIRTSLGGSLCVPFARALRWPDELERLRARGYAIAALDPAGDVALGDPARPLPGRVALVVGTEGAGLSPAVRAMADWRVRIPMAPGVDSVNVATAAAIALHHLLSAADPGVTAPAPDAQRSAALDTSSSHS
jgi:tRNA G18 (ribose-2'-O)-methylase SpoU